MRKSVAVSFAVIAIALVVIIFVRNYRESPRLVYRKQISASCTLSVYRNTNEIAKQLGLVEYEFTYHSPKSGIGLVALSKIRVSKSLDELKLNCLSDDSLRLSCVFDAQGIVFLYDMKSGEGWTVGHSIGDRGTKREEWESKIMAIGASHPPLPSKSLEVISTDEQKWSL